MTSVSTTPASERDSLGKALAHLSISPAVHLSLTAVLGFVMLMAVGISFPPVAIGTPLGVFIALAGFGTLSDKSGVTMQGTSALLCLLFVFGGSLLLLFADRVLTRITDIHEQALRAQSGSSPIEACGEVRRG